MTVDCEPPHASSLTAITTQDSSNALVQRVRDKFDGVNRRVRKLPDGDGSYEQGEGTVWGGTAGSRSYIAGDSGNAAAVMSGREPR